MSLFTRKARIHTKILVIISKKIFRDKNSKKMLQASYVVSSTINVRILSFLKKSSTLQELMNKILVNLYLSLPLGH